jgi:CDP-glucose 4,6-dehydratase
MMRILVTGATGLVGKSLCENLKKDPENVVITIQRDIVQENISSDYVVLGSIDDPDIVRRAVCDYEVNEIYHLASQSLVRICANDPVSAYRTNVMGTVNIMEAARAGSNHVKSVLVSTSDKVYGHVPPPYDETTPLKPKFTYESTKACQDIVSQNYFHNYGVPTKVVRCANLYGPGDSNWSRLIPNTIRRVLRGEPPIVYKDVSGYIREFIYVEDAVSALTLISQKGSPGEIFAVGGFSKISIQSLVETIMKVCQSEIPIEYPPRAHNHREIREQYISANNNTTKLGWSPKVGLEEGLRRTLEYYRNT